MEGGGDAMEWHVIPVKHRVNTHNDIGGSLVETPRLSQVFHLAGSETVQAACETLKRNAWGRRILTWRRI